MGFGIDNGMHIHSRYFLARGIINNCAPKYNGGLMSFDGVISQSFA